MRILLLVCASLLASAQEPPPTIESVMAQANAKYLQRDYAASVELYKQARQLAEATPPEDERRYTIDKRLATVAAASSDYAAANRYIGEAIQFRLDHAGPGDPQALADRLQQVGIYRAMSDFSQARLALAVVISKRFEIGGRRAPELPGDLSLMGQVQYESHEKEAAARFWKSAITVRGEIDGPLDVKQVPDLDRLGGVYIDLQQYPEAEDTFRTALLIRESVLGPEHADLLATLDGLAYAYFGQKKWELGEAAYKRLIGLWTKSVGETHPMLAIALDKLAVFYAAQQKWPEAKEQREHANAIRALNLASGLDQEALDVASSGDMPGARTLAKRAVRTLDPPNPIYDALREQIIGKQ